MKPFSLSLLASLALALPFAPSSQAAETQTGDAGIGGTFSELFLKGSIDGKNLFMVVGMQDGWEATKDIAQWAVNADDIKADAADIRDELIEAGHDVADIDDAVKSGAHFAKNMGEVLKDNAPEIVKHPWRSLKKIPGAYRVNFDRARDSYYGSRNSAIGGLKYAGWAAWANIQGAYYLVIEAPVVAAGELLFTGAVATAGALAVPGAIVLQGLEIAWDVTAAAAETVWAGTKLVLKASAGVIASLATLTYSALSSGTAVALAGITAGGIALFKASKYVFYSGPRKFFYPVALERQTELTFDRAQATAEGLEQALSSIELPYVGKVSVDSKVGEYSSQFKLSATKKLVVIQVKVAKRKVRIELEASRAYLKLVRNLPEFANASKDDVKAALEAQLGALLAQLPLPAAPSALAVN